MLTLNVRLDTALPSWYESLTCAGEGVKIIVRVPRWNSPTTSQVRLCSAHERCAKNCRLQCSHRFLQGLRTHPAYDIEDLTPQERQHPHLTTPENAQVASKEFFLKTLPLFDGGDDVGMVLSPQCFHNLNLHSDIFNHSNVHFWEYMQPGYDALGFISCTGTNFLVIKARPHAHKALHMPLQDVPQCSLAALRSPGSKEVLWSPRVLHVPDKE